MAKQKVIIERRKPKKRPGRVAKNLNKDKKRSFKPYKGQGR